MDKQRKLQYILIIVIFFEGDSKFELLFTNTDGKFRKGENVSDFVTNISY